MPIYDVEADGRAFEVEAPDMATAVAALRNPRGALSPARRKGSVQPIAPEEVPNPSLGQRARDLFTGELRTQYPDAPEFAVALDQAQRTGRNTGGLGQRLNVRALSAVTPDPAAQVDIIRRSIPDLEQQTDAFGNVMLRAPSAGVTDWAYLNQPGVSGRDVDEFMSGTVATLPLAPLFGVGSTVARRAAAGAAAGGGSSVVQDVAATAAGSNQGIDPIRATLSAIIGAPLGVAGGRAARKPATGRAPAPAAAADDVLTAADAAGRWRCL
jgi:hypothetical protein